MFLREDQLTTLETSCLVIDMDLARKNCEEMQAEADRNHCKLRPHVKTHKMPRFAQMQLEAGASGITCCKVSEAEIMAKSGIQDTAINLQNHVYLLEDGKLKKVPVEARGTLL